MALTGKQIGIIAAGVVLVVVLYTLPKAVVKKEGDVAPAANRDMPVAAAKDSSEDTITNVPDTAHSKPISGEQLKEIALLKKAALSSSGEKALSGYRKVASQYKALSRYDSAAYYLEEVARKNNNISLLEEAGETYFEAFTLALKEEKRKLMLDKCQALLNEVLVKNPANLDAKSKLAMTYVESPNPMQGVMLLREVIQKDPDNELALFNLGQLSMRSQQFDKAVGRFEKLVSLHPKDSRYHYYLGQCYHSLKKNDQAVSSYKKALQFNTDPTAASTIEEALSEAQSH